MVNQFKEVKALNERVYASDLSAQLKTMLANTEYCGCIFRGFTFNTISKSWNDGLNNIPVAFTAVPSFPTPCTASTLDLVPAVGGQLNPQFPARIANISVVDIFELIPNSGNYTANILVEFNNGTRALKPVRSPLSFTVDTTTNGPSNRPFAGCRSTQMDFGTPSVITLAVPRNSSNAVNFVAKFCSLSRVGSGGNDGGGSDYCEVTHLGGLSWELSGNRGNDPEVICKMICLN
jgi:hypothetical protein